jgi:hypothetical protein
LALGSEQETQNQAVGKRNPRKRGLGERKNAQNTPHTL